MENIKDYQQYLRGYPVKNLRMPTPSVTPWSAYGRLNLGPLNTSCASKSC